MNPQQRHRLLLQGLVGDEHAQQFATDVSFNHSVEMLARMLPSMIDGFAVASSAAEAQRANAMDRLRRGLGIPDELADLFAGRPEGCPCTDPRRAVDPACPIHGLLSAVEMQERE